MINRGAFFNAVRASLFGGRMDTTQVAGMNAILDEAGRRGTIREHLAYMLATVFHETQRAMKPNVENLNYTTASRIRQVWPSRFPSNAHALPFVRNPKGLANKVYNGRMGNRPNSDDGWNYRGRGLPHLTGRDNYVLGASVTGVDIVTNPDRALELPVAVKILFDGMGRGWFTGKKLSDYITPSGCDYVGADQVCPQDVGARRTVNGTDRAVLIAGYADRFDAALELADIPRPPDVAPIPDPDIDMRPLPPEPEDRSALQRLGALVALTITGAAAWVSEHPFEVAGGLAAATAIIAFIIWRSRK